MPAAASPGCSDSSSTTFARLPDLHTARRCPTLPHSEHVASLNLQSAFVWPVRPQQVQYFSFLPPPLPLPLPLSLPLPVLYVFCWPLLLPPPPDRHIAARCPVLPQMRHVASLNLQLAFVCPLLPQHKHTEPPALTTSTSIGTRSLSYMVLRYASTLFTNSVQAIGDRSRKCCSSAVCCDAVAPSIARASFAGSDRAPLGSRDTFSTHSRHLSSKLLPPAQLYLKIST